MFFKKCTRCSCAVLTAIFTLLVPSALSQNQYKILHAFTATGGDGGGVYGGVAFDQQGNLFGTTGGGGAYGYGTVFELSPNSGGTWEETILASFMNGDLNGQEPQSTPAVDATGNVYVTNLGGAERGGNILQFMPNSMGWNLQVIYNFCSRPNCEDGSNPYSGVAVDHNGNLYGTAFVVFELSPASGGWAENVLYSFCPTSSCNTGFNPFGGVILDRLGNLYGATGLGGPTGGGVVYELRHAAETWKVTVPHSFGTFPGDGVGPTGNTAVDNSGDIFGVTAGGGTNKCITTCGTIYKLTPTSNGHWKETVLFDFTNGSTGFSPVAGVTLDAAGNIYGTTLYGGSSTCGCGTVFKLSPNSNGTWTYSVLHTFEGPDGNSPMAKLVLHNGKLYGTTVAGGGTSGSFGVVFELTP